jgi:hypothetical protein
MIRLTGLPSLRRCPDVTVGRDAEGIAIVFSGPGQELRMDVAWPYLGDADPEEEELRLLARLRELGYRVTRADAAGPG